MGVWLPRQDGHAHAGFNGNRRRVAMLVVALKLTVEVQSPTSTECLCNLAMTSYAASARRLYKVYGDADF